MKHTLRSFFSICLVLSLTLVQAQETTPVKSDPKTAKTEQIIPEAPLPLVKISPEIIKNDSIPVKTDRYGVRVGVDLYKLTRALYDKDYKGIELVGDYRLTKKYFLAAELGNENKTTDDDRVNFTTKGSYIKAGFDYNAYENWLDMENIISIGMRYGFSTFNQQLNSYRIYNANPYFGEVPVIPSGKKFDGLSASWIEVVAGVKAKVFDKPICEALLDQKYFNGIGNYLRSTILYYLDVNPFQTARDVIKSHPQVLDMCKDIPMKAYLYTYLSFRYV